jgi:sporulation-control protein spo0M
MKYVRTMVLRLGTAEEDHVPLSLALPYSTYITVGNETCVTVFGRNVSSV